MKKTNRRIVLAISVFLALQPAIYAIDSQLNKEIVALEVELTKMKTKSGEYSDMSEAALNRKIERTQKKLDKKKSKAKKEAEKDKERIKKGAKEAGKEIKEAGKEIGNTFKDIFN